MTDVLLINPHKLRYESQLKRVGMPIGLLSIAAYLRHEGVESRIIDSAAEGFDNEISLEKYSTIDGKQLLRYGLSDEKILAKIKDEKPIVVGIGNLASSHFENSVNIGRLVKNNFPDVKVVVGGPHVTILPEQALATGAFDYVVRGEGEITFSELTKAILNNQEDISEVKGIAYIKKDNLVITNNRPLISNIDNLPFPAYDLVSHLKYGGEKFHGGVAKNQKIAEFFTTRGCPMPCNFCSAKSIHGNRWRQNSLEYITNHLDEIVNQGFKELIVEDDNFLVNKERAIKIMDEIKQRGFVWTEIGGVNITQLTKNGEIDYRLIDKMAEFGCYEIYLAIETANPESLRNSNKTAYIPDRELARDVVRYLNKNKISAFGGFMIGFENETYADITNTLNFAKELIENGMYYALLFNVTPLPGTILGERNKNNIVGIQADYSFERSNYNTEHLKANDVNALWPVFMSYVNGPKYNIWKKEGRWPTALSRK